MQKPELPNQGDQNDSTPFLSIIVPTYQRAARLERLLVWLFAQAVNRQRSELIIVDDGSADDTWKVLSHAAEGQSWLRPFRQSNQGQAAARQLGVDNSRGDVLLFLDDDMQPAAPDFFEQHRTFHSKANTVALGGILPPPGDPQRPAFEYFYEKSIRRMYEDFSSGRQKPAGKHFFSANVSLPKRLFLSVGGFDRRYRHAEDRELGLRLEMKAGAQFCYLPAAAAYHHSPTGRYASFIRRAELYGGYDLQMAALYPERLDLHPKSILENPPALKRNLARLIWRFPSLPAQVNQLLVIAAEALHRIGFTVLALPFCSVLYTINYARGLRLASPTTHAPEKDASHAA